MLTNTQQQTIEFITAQFEKLNASAQPTKYNLVDIQPLIDKSERIMELDEEEKIQLQIWIKLQKNEVNRIVDLLIQDLPDNVMIWSNCYGGIKICKKEKLDKNYDDIELCDCVRILVNIGSDSVYDKYSEKWRKEYNRLYYGLNNTQVKYSTIEELCSSNEFKDTLIERIL